MSDLLVAVPSRGRPQNILRLIDAMADTCTLDTRLVVGLDMDDPLLSAYMKIKPRFPMELVVEPRMRQVVAWINHLVMPRLDAYPCVGHIGDDNVPCTKGWDQAVVDALQNEPMCFADDLNRGRSPGSLCCHVFMRSEMVRTLGYFAPPILRHMYADDVWWEWGKAVGIAYLSDVVIEHMHPSVGKVATDSTYEGADACLVDDANAFADYRAYGLADDLAKLT